MELSLPVCCVFVDLFLHPSFPVRLFTVIFCWINSMCFLCVPKKVEGYVKRPVLEVSLLPLLSTHLQFRSALQTRTIILIVYKFILSLQAISLKEGCYKVWTKEIKFLFLTTWVGLGVKIGDTSNFVKPWKNIPF